PRAAVDVAAGDRAGLGVGVLHDRRQDGGWSLLAIRLIGVVPLVEVPAVVATAFDAIDQLPEVLADVAGPEVARGPVEADPPGVARAVGPAFGPGAGKAHERVIRGNAVRLVPLGMVHVDAKDGARQVGETLPVVGPAAVAGRDVQTAVRAEDQAAAV